MKYLATTTNNIESPSKINSNSRTKTEHQKNDTEIDQIYKFIIENYQPFYNIFDWNHYVILNNTITALDKSVLSSIYIETKRNWKNISKEIVNTCLITVDNPQINPIHSFIESHKGIKTNNELNRFTECFDIVTGFDDDNFDPNFAADMLKIWFGSGVKMWASDNKDYNTASHLMLSLYGAQGIGKDYTLENNLLPRELSSNYVTSVAFKSSTKDLNLLMTQNLLLIDSESRFNKEDERQFLKDLISKGSYKVRMFHTQNTPKFKRQALLASTSNESELLNDPSGNRRIIPLHVLSIDWYALNKIDKTALLIDTYNYVIQGGKTKILKEDIERLNSNTKAFQSPNVIDEIIKKHFVKAVTHKDGLGLPDIINQLSSIYGHTKIQFSGRNIKKALESQGYTVKQVRCPENKRPYMYNVKFVTQ